MADLQPLCDLVDGGADRQHWFCRLCGDSPRGYAQGAVDHSAAGWRGVVHGDDHHPRPPGQGSHVERHSGLRPAGHLRADVSTRAAGSGSGQRQPLAAVAMAAGHHHAGVCPRGAAVLSPGRARNRGAGRTAAEEPLRTRPCTALCRLAGADSAVGRRCTTLAGRYGRVPGGTGIRVGRCGCHYPVAGPQRAERPACPGGGQWHLPRSTE